MATKIFQYENFSMRNKERAILDVCAACDRASFTMEKLERVCSIRSHHVYKEIWKAAVGN